MRSTAKMSSSLGFVPATYSRFIVFSKIVLGRLGNLFGKQQNYKAVLKMPLEVL